MYKKGAMMELPPPATKIWRYMDLTKLIALMESNCLYFANVLSFDDPYECYLPVPTFEQYRDLRLYDDAYADVKPEDVQGLYEHDIHSIKDSRKLLFVNCWHISDHESAATWKLYPNSPDGVAIQSTVARLIESLSKAKEDVLIGKVKYVDYTTVRIPNNVFYRAIHKRLSFSHEKELRAVFCCEEMQTYDCSPIVERPGINVSVAVDELIERILVAPTSPSWIRDLMEAIAKRYGLNKPVDRSSLTDGPVW